MNKILETSFEIAGSKIDNESPVPLVPSLYEDIKEDMISELEHCEISVNKIVEYYEDAYYCGMDFLENAQVFDNFYGTTRQSGDK